MPGVWVSAGAGTVGHLVADVTITVQPEGVRWVALARRGDRSRGATLATPHAAARAALAAIAEVCPTCEQQRLAQAMADHAGLVTGCHSRA